MRPRTRRGGASEAPLADQETPRQRPNPKSRRRRPTERDFLAAYRTNGAELHFAWRRAKEDGEPVSLARALGGLLSELERTAS
jgi:hypothetical protein